MNTRTESEQRALWSRATQAKQAIERVMDMMNGTFEPSLSLALDRLEELRDSCRVHNEGVVNGGESAQKVPAVR
jgi:hypothetical protein